jgi:hypothetical protein
LKNDRIFRSRYFWLTLLTSCAISLLYFGTIWHLPNAFLFTSSGDGLQGYYQSTWHTQFDSSAWQQSSMNYPYGESVFFTGGQAYLTNPIRWIQPIWDLSEYTVGISNAFILLSGIFGALFLFLGFRKLKVDERYAWLFSCAIMMLAQQWDRAGGHFALAVMCAIPMLLWLLLGFFEAIQSSSRSAWKWSLAMGCALFYLGLIQFYYLFFAAVIALGMGGVHLLFGQVKNKWSMLVQMALQFSLAFAALQMLLHASTDVVDRTSIPWGFLIFRSSWMSYVFPYGMPYEHMFQALKPTQGLEWEGLGYIGLAGIVLILVVKLTWLKRKFSAVAPQQLESRVPLMSLAVAAVLCMGASMAFPFNWGFEQLLYRLGAVQQFRGIGRFAFVAYYPLMLFLVALFFHQVRQSLWRNGIAAVVLILFVVDGNARLEGVASRIAKERGSALCCAGIGMEGVDASDFQAIHPLPYVHVGSENIGFTGSDEAMQSLYQASLQMRLPTTAAVMSRTSLSQSFSSCNMAWDLMQRPTIVNAFPDKRPMLVIADTIHLKPQDRLLLHHAKHLKSVNGMAYYSLPLDAFEAVLSDNARMAESSAAQCTIASGSAMLVDDVRWGSLYLDTTWNLNFNRSWQRLRELPVDSAWQGKEVAISFWVKDFTRDLLPRSVLEVAQFAGEKSVEYQIEFMGKRIIGMRDNDALLEYYTTIEPGATRITLALENKLIQGETIEINSMLVRPVGANCRILRHGKESLNNRIYSR